MPPFVLARKALSDILGCNFLTLMIVDQFFRMIGYFWVHFHLFHPRQRTLYVTFILKFSRGRVMTRMLTGDDEDADG